MKKAISLLLILALAVGLIVPVSAAATESVDITYRAIKIMLNGEEITPCDEAGNTVEPFIMNSSGTTYLPLRAIAQALGLSVAWDSATSTVTLTSGGEVKTGAGESGATAGTWNVDITYRGIKVVLDGEELELKNAAGAAVEPFIMGGTTYLPLRVVGEALGLEIGWDSETNTASVQKAPAQATPDYSTWIYNEFGLDDWVIDFAAENCIKKWNEEFNFKIGFLILTEETASKLVYDTNASIELYKSMRETMGLSGTDDYFIFMYCPNQYYTGNSANGILSIFGGLVTQVYYYGISGYYSDNFSYILEDFDKKLSELHERKTSETPISSGLTNAEAFELVDDIAIDGNWIPFEKFYLDENENRVVTGMQLTASTDYSALTIAYNYAAKTITITAAEQYTPFGAEGSLDENGKWTGISGYNYESRLLIKEILNTILGADGENVYESMKQVFLGESYAAETGNPSALSWVNSRAVEMEMFEALDMFHAVNHCFEIVIYEKDNQAAYFRLAAVTPGTPVTYEGKLGADKFIAAYELDRW